MYAMREIPSRDQGREIQSDEFVRSLDFGNQSRIHGPVRVERDNGLSHEKCKLFGSLSGWFSTSADRLAPTLRRRIQKNDMPMGAWP
jgi:hypothetical protein